MGIVFEGLLAIAKVIGEWMATMHMHEWQLDHRSTALMYSIGLEGLGKVGTYVILALTFVPEWTRHQADGGASCSDLWSVGVVGESSLACLQRRLPPDLRRYILTRSMKGPFVVAPFLAIIIKVVIPWVADRLDLLARRCVCHLHCCDVFGDALARLLALIFAYDGDHVGCFAFLTRGWPFADVTVETASSTLSDEQQDAEALVHTALQEAALKPFEPLDELLELKLSFLWVVFFAPLKPLGVVPTFGARFLERHTDLTKLLYVRRRPFPGQAEIAHETQSAFVWGAGLRFLVVGHAISSRIQRRPLAMDVVTA